MRDYSLGHLADDVLLHDLGALIARERTSTAEILAHIAEVDARRLYVGAGHTSMFVYCVEELHLSEDAAAKRIHAARAAREFPVLLAALADGRIHLSGICLLAPHLSADNVEEWIRRATHRRKSEIEEMVGARSCRAAERPAVIRALPPRVAQHIPSDSGTQHAPGHVDQTDSSPEIGSGVRVQAPGLSVGTTQTLAGSGQDSELDLGDKPASREHAPGHVDRSADQAVPATAERFLLQVTIGKQTREKIRQAQALLSHTLPSGDVAQVLDRALDSLIAQLERQKLGAGTRRSSKQPGTGRTQNKSISHVRSRYIPAAVRGAVWERDNGQCTFVAANGRRCGTRRFLQFDHVDPFARGGASDIEGLRLRCGAHNRYEAERIFGSGFMKKKREEARSRKAARPKPERSNSPVSRTSAGRAEP
jgi:5-methylcytosine-specific restriction endonuclease McrA